MGVLFKDFMVTENDSLKMKYTTEGQKGFNTIIKIVMGIYMSSSLFITLLLSVQVIFDGCVFKKYYWLKTVTQHAHVMKNTYNGTLKILASKLVKNVKFNGGNFWLFCV